MLTLGEQRLFLSWNECLYPTDQRMLLEKLTLMWLRLSVFSIRAKAQKRPSGLLEKKVSRNLFLYLLQWAKMGKWNSDLITGSVFLCPNQARSLYTYFGVSCPAGNGAMACNQQRSQHFKEEKQKGSWCETSHKVTTSEKTGHRILPDFPSWGFLWHVC